MWGSGKPDPSLYGFMNKYKLGEYEFDTYEELLAAEEDTKKIDVITSSMDVTELEVALSLYEKIRNNEIVFHSSVGSGFFMYLSDIVVAGARTMVEEEKEKESRLRKKHKASVIYRVIGVTLIACAAVIFSYIYRNDMAERRSEEELARVRKIQNLTGSGISDEEYSENVVEDNTALLNELRKQREEAVKSGETEIAQGSEKVKKKLKILPEYQTLYAENTDFVGWISIEGTEIDYPVMQTKEADGQFYLDHSFYRSSDKNGTLFMDVRNDFVNRDTNLIIYGHNMKSGVMFGGLKKYLDDDYLKSHRTITFNTIYEKNTYEIIGAGLSEVSFEDEYTFRYYNFLNAGNRDEWDAFRVNMKQLLSSDLSLFDADMGDELLTLSTCSSYREQGRMFIIAKKIT